LYTLASQGADASVSSGALGGGGLSSLDLVGMGGVGKTQLSIEFCYRQYTSAAAARGGEGRLMYIYTGYMHMHTHI